LGASTEGAASTAAEAADSTEEAATAAGVTDSSHEVIRS
jgi:hypothetical protein